jgi:hypothetical protein
LVDVIFHLSRAPFRVTFSSEVHPLQSLPKTAGGTQ